MNSVFYTVVIIVACAVIGTLLGVILMLAYWSLQVFYRMLFKNDKR